MSRILVVEDEAHLANGLRFNLEAEGHAIEITDNGEEALRRLLKEKQQFDAVVLDVMLPGKDGFSVAKELRDAQHFIPVLMLTARRRPEDVLRGFESGADDYLPKPFNLAILIARIGSLLRRKQWLANGAVAEPETTNATADSFSFSGKHVDFQKLQLRQAEGLSAHFDGIGPTALSDPEQRPAGNAEGNSGKGVEPARRHRHARHR